MNILKWVLRQLSQVPTLVQAIALLFHSGAPLDEEQQREFFDRYGVPWPGPGIKPRVHVLVWGRQSGKSSFVASGIAVATAFDPRTVVGLPEGEVRWVIILSPIVRQTQIVFRKVSAQILNNPKLRRHVVRVTASEIELSNGVIIACWTAKSASLRGLQVACLILDEAAHFVAEGGKSVSEIMDAVGPGQAHIEDPSTIIITTPYTSDGFVFDAFRNRRTLAEDGIYVSHAPSWVAFPDFPKRVLRRAERTDPELYRREYGAEFVAGLTSYLSPAHIEAATIPGRRELPPLKGARYFAAVDLGFRRDSFVLAIGHLEGPAVVVDRVRTWHPPVKLSVTLPEITSELAQYRVKEVSGDQFSSEAFKELLAERSYRYKEIPFTSTSKPAIYDTLKTNLTEGTIELLDDAPTNAELRRLECRLRPGGGMSINAPSGQHDDRADAVALLCYLMRPANRCSHMSYVGLPGDGYKDLIWHADF